MIKDDLQQICDWCFENYLLLNLDNTKLMVFSSPQMIFKPLSFKLSFLGKELLLTDSVKGLGVILDPTLAFDCHISAFTASCIPKLAQINQTKQHLQNIAARIISGARKFDISPVL